MQCSNVTRLFGITVFGLTILLAAAAAQAGYMDDVLTDNPVGYWRLDDASGSATAANKISGGVAGTYNNFESGDYGKPGAINSDSDTAAGFDGSNNYISMPETVFTGVGTGAFSVELWFNANTTARGDVINYKGDGGDFGLWSADNKLGFWSTTACVASNNSNPYTGTTTLETGAWYHLVVTRDASSNVTAYINGIEQFAASGSTESFGSIGHAFWVGSNHNDADNVSAQFSGSIDEVAIYTSALSLTDVKAHYNAGIAVPEPSAMILLSSALIGLLCYAWRKRK